MPLRFSFGWIVVCAICCCANNALCAGIAIPEQSVSQLGFAFAGGAAAAEDASTIFYNPAGLSRLSRPQVLADIHLLFPSAQFSNKGSSHLTGQPLTGDNGGNAGSTITLPVAYFAQPLNSRFSAGLGIFAPFGLKTAYDQTWVGRYHAVNSELYSLSINPSIAYRVTDKLSIGAGISAQYLNAEISNAVDFGTIFAAQGAPGFAPQMNDGFVNFKGDSWSWGYNVGALYEVTSATRVGAAYRSRIDHTLRGNAHFSNTPAVNPTGRFIDTGIKADTTLPDSISISIWHNFTKELAATADITWTNWSTIDELRIRFDNPAESDAVTTLHWKDTLRYSVGTAFAPGPWTFRAGVAYDESPVPDADHRTPRIPDNDRITVAAGLGYKISDRVTVNAGYSHLFIRGADIRKSATGENQFRGGLSGSYRSSVNIVSSELSWQF